MVFRKGDRVEWHEALREETFYGVIDRVRGDRISATEDGGKRCVNGPAAAFKHSDKSLPTDTVPTEMDRYSVRGYKSIMGTDGYALNASIYRNNTRIIEVMNGGYGGPNEYYPVKVCTPAMLREFFEHAKAWCNTFGYEDPMDAADLWFEWYVHSRPYGVTGEAYIGDLVQSLKAIDEAKAKRNGENPHGTE